MKKQYYQPIPPQKKSGCFSGCLWLIVILVGGFILLSAFGGHNPHNPGNAGGKALNFSIPGVKLPDLSKLTSLSFSALSDQAQAQGTHGALVPAPPGHHTIIGGADMSASKVDYYLCNSSSPACGLGADFVALSNQYGIKSSFVLALFWHESNFGTKGEARTTYAIGNIRCHPGVACVDQQRGGYSAYDNWQAGLRDLYQMLAFLYVKQWHLTTVEQVIPQYAPPGDGNNDPAYIADVVHHMTIFTS